MNLWIFIITEVVSQKIYDCQRLLWIMISKTKAWQAKCSLAKRKKVYRSSSSTRSLLLIQIALLMLRGYAVGNLSNKHAIQSFTPFLHSNIHTIIIMVKKYVSYVNWEMGWILILIYNINNNNDYLITLWSLILFDTL